MSKIHKLSPEMVAKIAAGEVIERPSFAVKELIENAIDAKATEIKIFIEQAGLKKIQIIDNGEGMSLEDLQKCYMPHTTSKLSDKDTLIGIKSFGFRGEALASVAAVSQLTINSRTEGTQTGNQIEIQHGKLIKSIPSGMPQGTIIIAENLFSQIPVRKKFLKSNQTEFRHIIDVVNRFALSYPSIRFILKHNSKIILDLPKGSSQKERVMQILGNKTSNFFLPIKKLDSHLSFTGFIAKPQLHSSTQSRQILFINKRHITDKLISLSVKEAFGNMLESNSYPVFVLFLELPYEMVDVNIHPRKEQVAFFNNQFIFQTIKESVMELLQENNITFQNLSWTRTGYGMTNSFAGKLLKQEVLDKEKFRINPSTSPVQINNLYIFAQSKNGITLIDQHAAHERVLFEKLKKGFLKQKKKNKIFQLKDPIVLELSIQEKMMIGEYKRLFKKLGFTFFNQPVNASMRHLRTEKKSNRSINVSKQNLDNKIILTHIPFIFQDRNPQELVQQILENLQGEIPIREIDKISEEMLAFLACRAAAKAGDKLTGEQMKSIILDLEKAPNNPTCPHGRPTQIIMSLTELDYLFKR